MNKTFSKLGFLMAISAAIIMGLQVGVIKLVTHFAPNVMENGDYAFLVGMLPMFCIGYPIMIALMTRIPAAAPAAEKKKMTVGQWIMAFLMCYALVYLSNLVGSMITGVIGALKNSPVQNVIMNISTEISPLVRFIILVLAAPVFEELIFRKLLVDRTVKYGEVLSIMLSGFLFALYHANLNQFVYAFVLGAFCAFIYVRTRNLTPVIVLHMAINFVGSMLGVLVLEKSGYMDYASEVANVTSQEEVMSITMNNLSSLVIFFLYAAALFIIVIIGFILLIVNRKKFAVTPIEGEVEKGNRIKTALFNPGMGVYTLLFVVMIVVQLFA